MSDELQTFEENDQLFIDGERFTVTDVQDGHAVLTPRNENGHAKIDWSRMKGRYLFRRVKGIAPSEITECSPKIRAYEAAGE